MYMVWAITKDSHRGKETRGDTGLILSFYLLFVGTSPIRHLFNPRLVLRHQSAGSWTISSVMADTSKTEKVPLHAPDLAELRGGKNVQLRYYKQSKWNMLSMKWRRPDEDIVSARSVTGGTSGQLCWSSGECCGVSRSHRGALPVPCQR